MKRKTILLLLTLILNSNIAAQRKVVTNADLEKFRQKRVQADADYDKKAKESGLPSRQELERREAERQQGLREFAAQAESKRTNAENYWQSQAADLYGEIASINAEINYVRARINQIPARQTYYSTGYLPYGFYNSGGFGNKSSYNNNGFDNNNGFNRTINGGSIVFGNRNQTRFGLNTQNTTRRNSRFTVASRFSNGTRGNSAFGNRRYQNDVLIAPYNFSDYNDSPREELLIQLNSLEQTRAGLLARFSLIQDAARRDGVQL